MVVCDTSPIVSLAMIGQASVLGSLYHTLCIPPSVYDEIVAGDGQAGAVEVQDWQWVQVRPVSNTTVARVLALSLDTGESEAIALALESAPELLLLDERKARRVAIRLGLPVAGTLDALVAAKQAGLIPAVRPVLDDLLVRAHFRVGRALYQKLLKSVGEDPAPEQSIGD
jgi:predicted nucleic acid-binding protein